MHRDTVEAPTDSFGAALRGYGWIGVLALILILLAGNLVGAILVVLWAWRSRTPPRELGLTPPMSWPATITLGVAIGISLKFIAKAIVLPLLGADPINHAYSYLIGNPAALPGILATVVVGGGVGEEIIWRGYLFERLAPLRRAGGAAAVLMVSTALFALAHYADQGWSGVQQALVTGLVFGGVFLATGRLWTGMIAHALFDVTAVLMIYWNAEEKVAHLIFH